MAMVHELRIYTVKPGTVMEVAKNAGEVGRAIRGDTYGKLEGYWVTEIGPLNQVCHLWSYSDWNERTRLRGELAKNERWTKEYGPLIRPNLVRQDIRLLNPIVGIKPPTGTGNIYELRAYRTKPGAIKEWSTNFTEALHHREKYSKIVGFWNTEAGQPNEVVHLWSYPDLNTRMAQRAASQKDENWQAFIKKAGGLLEELTCMIMLPAAHSPLK